MVSIISSIRQKPIPEAILKDGQILYADEYEIPPVLHPFQY